MNKHAPGVQAQQHGLYRASPKYAVAPRIVGVLALHGCASGAAGTAQQETAFRQLQVYEARLARAEATLPEDRGCTHGVEQVGAVASICAASRDLCALTSGLSDRDASSRCLRAGDACSAAREHSRARCATHAP